MVAESRNIDACYFTRLKNGHSLGDLHGVTVDENLDRIVRVGEMDPGAGDRSPGGQIARRALRLGLCGGGFRLLELGFGDNGSEKKKVVRVWRIEKKP